MANPAPRSPLGNRPATLPRVKQVPPGTKRVPENGCFLGMLTLLLVLSGLFPTWVSQAAPLSPAQVPPPLVDWVDWVLWNVPDHACPRLDGNPQARSCVWPASLRLDLHGSGGVFWLEVGVFATQPVPLALPGDDATWPQEVRVSVWGRGQPEDPGGTWEPGAGQPVPVVSREGKPVVWLPAGQHRLHGRFHWDLLPATLNLPPQLALVTLKIEGQEVPFPVLNDRGQLWLSTQATAAAAPQAAPEDRLRLQVFRRLEEGVPLGLTSRLVLEIAGRPREIVLPATLPPGLIPMALTSPLPARLEADGRLVLQARPGHWELTLQARYPDEVSAFPFPELPDPWPAEELWVYQANTAVRLTEPQDAPAIDPRQTELPAEWRSLPAFRLSPGVTLRLDVIRRGDPQPEPDRLHLRRHIWLDFDGQGFSVRDRITGTLTAGWRLDAGPDMTLGRVDLDGDPQSITLDQTSGREGVELRRGRLDLSADSRMPRATRISATGWARDFSEVSAELNLPPGWRLFTALGVDHAPGSWLAAWTLLDFFLVLVITLAVGRLFGWGAAVLALAALALTWQEEGAPQYVWLNLLAALALARVLPATSGLSRWIRAYRLGSLLALALIAIPFLAGQLRLGLYPQLEHPYLVQPTPGQAHKEDNSADAGMLPLEAEVYGQQAPAPAAPLPRVEGRSLASRGKGTALGDALTGAGGAGSGPDDLKRLDPDALTQTGPGLPDWRWHRVNLNWQGPVQAGQEMRLILVPPIANLTLAVLRLVLILGLVFLLAGGRDLLRGQGPGPGSRQARDGGMENDPAEDPPLASAGGAKPSPAPRARLDPDQGGARAWVGSGWGVLILLAMTLPPNETLARDLPTPELLNELQARLLAPPDCEPGCAEIPRLTLTAEPDRLRLELELDVATRMGIPLPAQTGQWVPSTVAIDGTPATALLRGPEGHLWVLVGPGRHRLVLTGPLPARERLSLPLPLRPRQVKVVASGWRITGIGDNGVPEVQLLLTREGIAAGTVPGDAAGASTSGQTDDGDRLPTALLPPFLELERTLVLDLSWRLVSRLRRLTPAEAPLTLSIPLLPGEAVLTPGFKVSEGRLSANLPVGEDELTWESQLAPETELTLTAPATRDWTEIWRLDASPIWHLTYEGLAPVHHQSPAGQWQPEWRPWAGESLRLRISRPAGAPGASLTVDASELRLRPGDRETEVSLKLLLRASRGGRQAVDLPKGARLQSVTLDGIIQPIRLEEDQVLLPVRPGTQEALIIWHEDHGIAPRVEAPAIGLGTPSVNATTRIELGRDRWVLWAGGPMLGRTLGPAVLFWSLIPLILLVALALARIPLSPASAWQWGLLLLGLTQAPVAGAVLVVAWLLALAWRGAKGQELSDLAFNLAQIGLVLLSLQALSALAAAVAEGLLGQPAMQIAGNGSGTGSGVTQLIWYQDRGGETLPQPWVLSAPLWVYRLLMLAWALWLANSLLNWLRWGWACFSAGGLWRKSPRPLFARWRQTP